ncbi:hypothetical protein BJX76DRAFT_346522 [Aspergillus varians]
MALTLVLALAAATTRSIPVAATLDHNAGSILSRTGDSCAMRITMPDLDTPATRPCLQGSVPCMLTLLFAKDNGLRLDVKNTGHDYLGRSSAPDSFALWTHHIQPPIELIENFVPDQCSEAVGDVIAFGAGQQFGGVYDFANAHGYRVVGGTSPSVGIAGGWTAGGGHSMLSNELGLGVDNNQDIFFALRGGGGGTFGVVTEMSYSVHPKKSMQFARVSLAALNEDASMQPLIDLANRPAESGTLGNASASTADYHHILQAIIAREEDLVFPSSAWALSSPQDHDVAASSGLLIYAVAPNLYSRTMPEPDLPSGPGACSITPAWRNGLWHVIFTRQFDGTPTNLSEVQQIWQTTHEIMNSLRDLTPSGVAYQNEADPFEPDPISSFWGKENYARLLQIKREVDPTNLLTVRNGVGWDEMDGRYSCYPDIKISATDPAILTVAEAATSKDEL